MLNPRHVPVPPRILDTHGGVRTEVFPNAATRTNGPRRSVNKEEEKTRLLFPFFPTGGRQRTCHIETKTKAGVISDKWMRLMFVLPVRVLCVCVCGSGYLSYVASRV